ncbi:MAG: serine/threonine protein kinase [Microbacteriaceae bacterium]|nr:serine/threonine protein kinase [Microbacteriaceae bacterium]
MARRPQSSPPVLPGFAYVRPLGAGGFADVFLYEQDMPRRVVAVKVLSADAINPEVRRLFNAEADVMAQLSAHPSILTIYQASVSSDGRPYLATEFCPESFGDRYKQSPLALPTVLDAGIRMAAALETAHRAGVLHRDIKPSNILVTQLGQPVLADFGIATSLAAIDDSEQLVAMSIPWSSPEVVTEATTGSVQTEVWSLGATMYTLLAGRSPFAAPEREKNTRDLMRERVVKAHYTPLRRPDVPPQVEQLLARSMAKDPAQRPQGMLAFAEELRWVQQELGLPLTSIEVANHAWAASPTILDQDDRRRGPVVSTVLEDSRRAARAAKRNPGASRNVDEGIVQARPAGAWWKGGLIGGAIAGVLIAGTILALVLTGVIG